MRVVEALLRWGFPPWQGVAATRLPVEIVKMSGSWEEPARAPRTVEQDCPPPLGPATATENWFPRVWGGRAAKLGKCYCMCVCGGGVTHLAGVLEYSMARQLAPRGMHSTHRLQIFIRKVALGLSPPGTCTLVIHHCWILYVCTLYTRQVCMKQYHAFYFSICLHVSQNLYWSVQILTW